MSTGYRRNFRSDAIGGTHEIVNLMGSYIPFALTKAEREARKDTRASIQERYSDEHDYLAKLHAAAEELVKGRYLLSEDVENVMKRGQQQWEFVTRQRRDSGFYSVALMPHRLSPQARADIDDIAYIQPSVLPVLPELDFSNRGAQDLLTEVSRW